MGMDKELAINILIAVAVCSTTGLICYECPLWDKEKCTCRPWADDEVRDAVHTLSRELSGERKGDGNA